MPCVLPISAVFDGVYSIGRKLIKAIGKAVQYLWVHSPHQNWWSPQRVVISLNCHLTNPLPVGIGSHHHHLSGRLPGVESVKELQYSPFDF
jgi:hypothetical protein